MSQPQPYEVLVLGSGEGGKYLAWHMATSGRPDSRGGAEMDRRLLPEHQLPPQQERNLEREGRGPGSPRGEIRHGDRRDCDGHGSRAAAQTRHGRWKEKTVNPNDLGNGELVTLPSSHGTSETVERLKALLAQKEIQVFAHIDHAAGAKKVGLALRPTQVVIFGNPQAGTPLMQSHQTIGLDLPLRVLVWEDAAGKVWLTYRRPEFLRGTTTLRITTKS